MRRGRFVGGSAIMGCWKFGGDKFGVGEFRPQGGVGDNGFAIPPVNRAEVYCKPQKRY